jgi:hypothetical protein
LRTSSAAGSAPCASVLPAIILAACSPEMASDRVLPGARSFRRVYFPTWDVECP